MWFCTLDCDSQRTWSTIETRKHLHKDDFLNYGPISIDRRASKCSTSSVHLIIAARFNEDFLLEWIWPKPKRHTYNRFQVEICSCYNAFSLLRAVSTRRLYQIGFDSVCSASNTQISSIQQVNNNSFRFPSTKWFDSMEYPHSSVYATNIKLNVCNVVDN